MTRSTDGHGPIEVRLRQRAFVQTIQQRLLKYIMVEVIELHIDAGADGQAHRILGRGRNMMRGVEPLESPQGRTARIP